MHVLPSGTVEGGTREGVMQLVGGSVVGEKVGGQR